MKKFCSQAWLLNLPQIRLCLESGVVPPEALCDVLQELLDHWSDVKICLSNDVLLMRKTPISWMWIPSSVQTVWVCLGWLYCMFFCCFRSNCKKLFESDVTDYSCRSFTDFCFFYRSLLSKVKKISQLPSIDNWFDYNDNLLNSWANVTASECLRENTVS